MRSHEDPALELRGLSKRFGWKWALREVSARVGRGTALCLVGPNGAGKTTLLKVVATLLRPSGGDGVVLGHRLREDADAIRQITALLTVRGYVYDDLTAYENLVFTARMAGRRVRRSEVLEVLERLGLHRVVDQRVRTFSTGMRKRLALGQLLVRPLEVALLDEPYAGLDAQGTSLVDEVVTEFKRAGTTVLIASHQDGGAVRDAEQTAVLRRGRIEPLPPATDVFAYLASNPDADAAIGASAERARPSGDGEA